MLPGDGGDLAVQNAQGPTDGTPVGHDPSVERGGRLVEGEDAPMEAFLDEAGETITADTTFVSRTITR